MGIPVPCVVSGIYTSVDHRPPHHELHRELPRATSEKIRFEDDALGENPCVASVSDGV